MEISARLNDDNQEILLKGNINSYNEYVEVKYFIKNHINKAANLTFYFVNSVSVNSYILGYILKLKEINKLNINIVVSNSKLYDFFQYADFHKFFNIKIKEYE